LKKKEFRKPTEKEARERLTPQTIKEVGPEYEKFVASLGIISPRDDIGLLDDS